MVVGAPAHAGRGSPENGPFLRPTWYSPCGPRQIDRGCHSYPARYVTTNDCPVCPGIGVQFAVEYAIAGVGPDAMPTTQRPDLAGQCSAAVSRSPVFVGVGTAAHPFLVILAGNNPFLGYCF